MPEVQQPKGLKGWFKTKKNEGARSRKGKESEPMDVTRLSKNSNLVQSQGAQHLWLQAKEFLWNHLHVWEEAGKGLGIGALIGCLAFALKAYREGNKKPHRGANDLPVPAPYLQKFPQYMEYIRELQTYAPRAPLLFEQLLRALNHLCLMEITLKMEPQMIRYAHLHKYRQWTNYALQACDRFAMHVKKVTVHMPLAEKQQDTKFNLAHWDERTRQLHHLIQQNYRSFATKAEMMMQQHSSQQAV